MLALAVGAIVGVGGGHADADPTPAAPPYRNYAAVGSDTTQSVWNGLTNPTASAVIKQVASWDAFGSATIKTKSAGATFTRPAGSGNGVKALSAQYDPNYPSHDWMGTKLTHSEVDFARSSSGPVAGTGLTYLPFARDAVSVALKPISGFTATNFSTAQLTAIYGGSDDNSPGTGITYDTATGKPKYRTKILSPLLPQSGSGTRNFFLSAIGITTTADLGAYVEPSPSTIPENDGTQLTAAGQLIPFSAAQWIAQANGVQTDTTAGLTLFRINELTPFTGTAPKLKPGTLFGAKDPQGNYSTPPVPGVGVFNRDTYNVIPTAFLTGTPFQATLVGKLTGNAAGQLGAPAAKTVINKYGFGNLSYLGDPSQYKDGAFQH